MLSLQTAVLIFVLWSSGIVQPLLIQLISYEGAGEKYTLLYMVPNYVGMSLLLLAPPRLFSQEKDGSTAATAAISPDHSSVTNTPADVAPISSRLFARVLRWPRRYRILFIAALDVFSFSGCFLGMMLCGSAIYTVIYSSVTTNTALLSWWLLDKRLSHGQWGGCIVVTIGLAISAAGDTASGSSVAIGALIVLLGTILHSFMYVANEAVMTRGPDQLPPVRLCGLVGAFGCVVIGLWQLAWTIPQYQTQVVDGLDEHHTSVGRVLVLYTSVMVVDLVHAGVFYVLLGQVGSVTTGVLKGATAITVFVFSAVFFCDRQKSQCFSLEKGVSLALVVIGVALYSYFTNAQKRNSDTSDMQILEESHNGIVTRQTGAALSPSVQRPLLQSAEQYSEL